MKRDTSKATDEVNVRVLLETSPGAPLRFRNDLRTRRCHSELVSESPGDGNNPDEILKRVQDDTLVWVLRSFLDKVELS